MNDITQGIKKMVVMDWVVQVTNWQEWKPEFTVITMVILVVNIIDSQFQIIIILLAYFHVLAYLTVS